MMKTITVALHDALYSKLASERDRLQLELDRVNRLLGGLNAAKDVELGPKPKARRSKQKQNGSPQSVASDTPGRHATPGATPGEGPG